MIIFFESFLKFTITAFYSFSYRVTVDNAGHVEEYEHFELPVLRIYNLF